MAFPTLSRSPLRVNVKYRDNKVTGVSEDGYVYRRPRVTREARIFTVSYDLIPTTDCDLLKTHYENVGLHTAFSWTDNESNTYTVYYDKPLSFTRQFPGWYKLDDLELREQ